MQPQATQTPPATEPKPETPPAATPATPPADTPPATPPAAPAATDKRPLWQWTLVYGLLGAIVLGLVYYVWLRG